MNKIYKYTPTGTYVRAKFIRASGINTYTECDINGRAIIKVRPWSSRKQEQELIIDGFENLEEVI